MFGVGPNKLAAQLTICKSNLGGVGSSKLAAQQTFSKSFSGGVGSSKLTAQQTLSKSNSGPITLSPNTFEPGECSYKPVEPIPSADIYEKSGECPLVTLKCSGLPMQVAEGLVRSQLDWVLAEIGGKSFSVPLRSSHSLTVTGRDPNSPAMDGLVIGTSINGPAAAPLEFEGFIFVGFNSDGPEVVQMENFLVPPRSSVSLTATGLDPDSPAMARLEIGTSSNGPAEALMEFKGTLTAGSNSNGPAAAQLEFLGVNCVDKAGSVSSELLIQGTNNEGTRQIDVGEMG
nr:hypothetical protein CFP56_31898 [Quercus suber]